MRTLAVGVGEGVGVGVGEGFGVGVGVGAGVAFTAVFAPLLQTSFPLFLTQKYLYPLCTVVLPTLVQESPAEIAASATNEVEPPRSAIAMSTAMRRFIREL